MFNKLIYYLEACHSGSMFKSLPNNLNIYSVTAANSNESSYAYFCYPNDIVNGVSIGSCLGDEFTYHLFNILNLNLYNATFTFHQSFLETKRLTKKSHVMEFGNKNLGNENIRNFFLGYKIKEINLMSIMKNFNQSKLNQKIKRIKSTNVKLAYLEIKASRTNNINALIEYQKELQLSQETKKRFEKFTFIIHSLNKENKNEIKTDFNCLRFSNEIYREKCGIDERDIEFLSIFSNFCSIYNLNYLDLYKAISLICEK